MIYKLLLFVFVIYHSNHVHSKTPGEYIQVTPYPPAGIKPSIPFDLPSSTTPIAVDISPTTDLDLETVSNESAPEDSDPIAADAEEDSDSESVVEGKSALDSLAPELVSLEEDDSEKIIPDFARRLARFSLFGRHSKVNKPEK